MSFLHNREKMDLIESGEGGAESVGFAMRYLVFSMQQAPSFLQVRYVCDGRVLQRMSKYDELTSLKSWMRRCDAKLQIEAQ